MKKKFIACGIYIFGAISCEVLAFALMGLPMPRFFIIDFSILFLIAGIIFIIPSHIAGVVLYSLAFLVQCIFTGAHVELYKIFGDVFTTDLLSLIDEAKEALGAGGGEAAAFDGGENGVVLNWWLIVPFLIFPVLMIIAQVLVTIFVKSPKFSLSRQTSLLFAFTFCFFCFGMTSAASARAAQLPGPTAATITGVGQKQNFDNFYYKVNYFKSFGTFSLFFKNVVLGTQHSNILQKRGIAETKQYFDSAPSMNRHNYGTAADPIYGPDKDNNAIVVMLETGDEIFINENTKNLMPTLYTLMQESINFTNFHSQHKTDVSETMGILGGYPGNEKLVASWKEGGHRDADTRNQKMANEYPFSLPSVLGAHDYTSKNYFHPATGKTYARQYSHVNYGFDKAFFNESFTASSFGEFQKYLGTWQMPERPFFRDAALADGTKAIDLIMPTDEKFFSFITTVDGHWPYTSPPTDVIGMSNYARVQRANAEGAFDYLNMNAATKSLYMNALARLMTTDDGIAYLLEELETRALRNDTTLMFYADHNAYGNDLKYSATDTTMYMPQAFRVPAFIWSPNVAGFEVDKFTSPVDLVPTLLDLLDVEVNPRMYLGINAFDTQESISFSRLNVIFNDVLLTDGMYVLYQAPHVTATHKASFRESYDDLLYRWSFINRLYYPENPNYKSQIYEWAGK